MKQEKQTVTKEKNNTNPFAFASSKPIEPGNRVGMVVLGGVGPVA
jgi:hypothetical protein